MQEIEYNLNKLWAVFLKCVAKIKAILLKVAGGQELAERYGDLQQLVDKMRAITKQIDGLLHMLREHDSIRKSLQVSYETCRASASLLELQAMVENVVSDKLPQLAFQEKLSNDEKEDNILGIIDILNYAF